MAKTPSQWILEGEVGTSSKTIWAVMMGVVIHPRQCDEYHFGIPHDPDDFSRCSKLIALFPEWRSRLNEVPRIFPKWTPYIREWDKLEAMYREWQIHLAELQQRRAEYYAKPKRERGRMPQFADEMFDFMQTLYPEAMKLDGWIQISPNGYIRKEA